MERSSSAPCTVTLRTKCRTSSMTSIPTWVRCAGSHAETAAEPCLVAGWFSNTVGYGITYGATDVLSQVEISYVLVAALISMDTPRQIGWHLANAQHGGASLEEAKAIRQISIEVAEKSGIKWKDAVPEI